MYVGAVSPAGLVIVGMLDSRYDIRKIGQDIKPENEEGDGK